jgi:inner membrane protein
MASAITHGIVGAALALPAMRFSALQGVLPLWVIPVAGAMAAVAPDLDTYFARAFGLRDTIFWHRGFFHSAMFLFAFNSLVAYLVARGSRPAFACLALLWSVCAVTHPLLDMLTDGGGGVMLLYPFSSERLFFPWRPIRVSPLSVMRFFSRAGEILWSELPFIAAALALGFGGWRWWPKATSAVDIHHR